MTLAIQGWIIESGYWSELKKPRFHEQTDFSRGIDPLLRFWGFPLSILGTNVQERGIYLSNLKYQSPVTRPKVVGSERRLNPLTRPKVFVASERGLNPSVKKNLCSE